MKKIKAIPVMVGTLGAISEKFDKHTVDKSRTRPMRLRRPPVRYVP